MIIIRDGPCEDQFGPALRLRQDVDMDRINGDMLSLTTCRWIVYMLEQKPA